MVGLSLVITGVLFVRNAYGDDNHLSVGRPQFDAQVTTGNASVNDMAMAAKMPATLSSQLNASDSGSIKKALTSDSGPKVERDFYRDGAGVAK
jgi:hypothetical protein